MPLKLKEYALRKKQQLLLKLNVYVKNKKRKDWLMRVLQDLSKNVFAWNKDRKVVM